LHDAELIWVPEISEDGLYIGFVHAQNWDMNFGALFTNEGPISDAHVWWLIAVAVDAEFVVGVTGKQLLQQVLQFGRLVKVQLLNCLQSLRLRNGLHDSLWNINIINEYNLEV
jgi:hypothetical protein